MISYEEICQSLDKHNNRAKNEAELAQLDQVRDEVNPASSAFAGASEKGQRKAPSITSEQIPAAELVSQPPEDTHEIDVDDMFEDNK
jgi:hypothetical protein